MISKTKQTEAKHAGNDGKEFRFASKKSDVSTGIALVESGSKRAFLQLNCAINT